MSYLFGFFLIVFLIIAVLLCMVVLVQESKSMGLGASFGGESGAGSLFGTSTAAVLKKITAYLATIFMILCVVISLWTSASGRRKAAQIPCPVQEETPLNP